MATTRGTAAQRRSQAVTAGMGAFADLGVTTAAVQRVATEIGVSPPYLYRLFGSTQGFFLACLDELATRVRGVFRQAAGDHPAHALPAMGEGFRVLLADRENSGLWLQAFAVASRNEEVAGRLRALMSDALAESGRLSGAAPEELTRFLARGALVALLRALDVDLTGGVHTAVDRLRRETES
jgi:AcrR family transcriptional regulator